MKSLLNDESVLKKLRKANLLDCEPCTAEETTKYRQLLSEGKPLPKGVFGPSENGTFTKISASEFTKENEQHTVSVAQTLYLKSINGWLTFFGIMAIIGLVGGLITIIAAFAR